MKSKIGIISLVFLLFFQNLMYGTSFPTRINAAELGESILTNVTMTDSSGQLIDADKNEEFKPSREAKVELHYEWAISNATVKEGDTFIFQLPSVFQINSEINGSLLANDQTGVGVYRVDPSGQVTITFNQMEEGQVDASGKLSIPAEFDQTIVKEGETLPVAFDLKGKEQTIQVVFQSEVETPVENKEDEKPAEDVGMVDQKEEEKETEEEKEVSTDKAPAASVKMTAEAAKITENIITDVKLTTTDNVEIHAENNPDNRPMLGTEVGVHYQWKLPNGHKYGAGSTFEFQLPDAFQLFNEVDGELKVANGGNVGTFKVTQDGKITMTFNETITDRSDIYGELEVWSIFSEKLQGSTNQEINFPPESGSVTIPVHFQPKPGKTIEKSGIPNTAYNASSIDWTVDINKQLEKITKAVVKDPIQDGQELQPGSIQVFELGINLDGSTTVGALVDSYKYEIVKTADGKDFELQFQDETINKAYRIKYTTNITDADQTSYSNTATLSGDGKPGIDATSTVSVGRGKPLEKSAKHYNPLTQTIDWEIKYNYNEKTIAKDNAWLDDLFTNSHQLNGKFEVYKVTLDANGKEASSELVSNYTKTDHTDMEAGKNGFKLQFNEDISSAYKIVYQTVTTKQVFDSETIINKVTLSDKTEKIATRNTWQEILKKKNPETANYKDKTVNWTIELNGNNFNMKDGVLTDTFPNGGLELIEGSFEISGLTKGVDYELKQKDGSWRSGYIIEFKNPLTASHTITYTTKFDNDWKIDKTKTGFDNHADMSWTDGVTLEKKSKGTTAVFNPDRYTTNNGFKNGSYNAKTKEITWGIGVNYNLKAITDAKVEDFILQGQKLVEDSLKVYEVELNGEADGVIIGKELATDQYKVDYSITDEEGNPGFRIDFGEIAVPYYVTYQTSLKDQLIVKEYKNTATLFDGTDKLTDLTASVSVQFGGEYVKKQAKQNGKLVDWTIPINWGQSKISNAKITDTPSANLILLENSLHLYNTTVDEEGNVTKGEELTRDTDYKLEIKTDADDKQSFEISFLNDIDSAYILEYQTFINAQNGDLVSNAVKLTGEQITTEDTQKSKEFAVRLSGGSGTGSGETGNLVVTKVDAANKDQLLPGATFTLYDSKGEIAIKTATTDAEGKVTFKNLLYDDYLLKEDSAPEGYVVGIHEAGKVVKINAPEVKRTIENKKIVRSVELTKTDAELSSVLLPDAVYKLQYHNGTDFEDTSHSELKTDENGKIVIDDLKPGNYQFIETKAPFGYELDATPIPFTIEANQTEVDEVSHTNKIILGDVELTKVDQDDDKLVLKDAEFELQDKDGKVIKDKLTTNAEGKLLVEDLRPGDYQFVETKAPLGYKLDKTPIPFTIVPNQTEMKKVGHTNKIIVGTVELTKMEQDNLNLTLKDAEFELQDKDGKVLQEKLTTNEEGKLVVKDLRPGDYQFVETKAPLGYELDKTPIPFTIELNPTEMKQVNPTNKIILGAVELTKVDQDDDKLVLKDAEFELQDKDGKVLQEKLTTNEEGKLVVKDLRPGDYQFVETKAPADYELNATPLEFTIVKGQTETLKVDFENKLIPGDVELTKIRKGNAAITLKGAEFKLIDQEGKLIQEKLKTDDKGKVLVKDLRPGKYQFVETKAPSGYVLNRKPVDFTIEKSQTDMVKVTFENQLIQWPNYEWDEGQVELTKVDKDDPKKTLAGAVFTLKDQYGNTLKEGLTTDENGKIFVKNLKQGTYKFVETKAPFGYELNQTSVDFVIINYQTKATEVTFTNELSTGAVELMKVDKDDKKLKLENAVFELQDQNNKTIKSNLSTNKEGKLLVKDLKPGDYQFVETKAPSGYVLDKTPLKFKIDKAQKETLTVTFENAVTSGAVELTKVDEADGKLKLAGAVFQLQDQNGKVIKSNLSTNKEGKLLVKDLKPGKYQFVETKAPVGYVLDKTPLKFEIAKGQKEMLTVTFENTIAPGAVELTKVDEADGKLKLAGAVFQLQDQNGKVIKSNLSTNKEGKLLVTDLEPGKYQFVEMKAPVGYVLDKTPLQFTIDKDQKETAKVTAKNEVVEQPSGEWDKGQVELMKVDEDDPKKLLAGAFFMLKDQFGNIVKENLETDENGKLIVKDLKQGAYQFVETKAPAGYVLDPTPRKFTIEEGQTEVKTVIVKNKEENDDSSSGSGGDAGTGNNTGDNSGNNTGDNTGDNSGDNTSDNTGNNTNDNNTNNNGTNGSGKNPSNSNNQGNSGNSNNQPDNDKTSDSNNKLPNTATNMYTWLTVGIALLLLALILMVVTRRKMN
ncbi:SpaA isopeptide-forming pilin-related protein [Bacillus sp. FJAT-42315]|uniref:SpaA isopeptide-forming pilin-related protein n=1 Tax=Bacillus sp. FJAT-42315 TaxID=2014077 RepID=UPI000C234A8D|nr:SpaA isopeptide-forming pilin-related protein [Bacillus sp. FJAT-42315]